MIKNIKLEFVHYKTLSYFSGWNQLNNKMFALISTGSQQNEVKYTLLCDLLWKHPGESNMSGGWCSNYYLSGCFSAAGMCNIHSMSTFIPVTQSEGQFEFDDQLLWLYQRWLDVQQSKMPTGSTTVNSSGTTRKWNTVTVVNTSKCFTGCWKMDGLTVACFACSVKSC